MLGIADIADELGMSRSTTHRYLTTLVALGYMEQDKSRKYRLSLRVTDLGMSALNSTGLREHAHSVLEELRQGSNFTAASPMLDGAEIVYLDRVVSFQRGQDKSTSAWESGPAAARVLHGDGQGPARPSPRGRIVRSCSASEPRAPGAERDHGQGGAPGRASGGPEEGFATEDEEFAKGRIAIAAPVRNETGATIAAIDLSSHISVIALERLAGALRPHLIAAADRISARLGHRREDETASR